jgi:deoxyribodipyrimidine photo-lyase
MGPGLAETWKPGENGARERLDHFIEESVRGYGDARNLPGQYGTSRLSPHLHFGEISPRQIVRALQQAGLSLDSGGAEHFVREIGWREFGHHLLFHFPHTTDAPLNPRFKNFPWRESPDELCAWQRGRTGIPIVDAGMRELWQTGWMHNRTRMIVASLLVKNLRLHWLHGARWFWDTLVDADLASNTLGWQWVAGTGADAAPYFRIFNPVLQGQRFDPDGVYVRRHVPELAELAADVIHSLGDAPQTPGPGPHPQDYPDPIVDLKTSREAALEAFKALPVVASDGHSKHRDRGSLPRG